ncbi:MAG: glycoside hydrolase family 20 zincin-like fold domain-containing protein [Kiritimatiellia bacterium]|nr:beta-N-acetylhexosaminidase [Lentisphaerota bacterium]
MQTSGFLIPPRKFNMTGGRFRLPSRPVIAAALAEDVAVAGFLDAGLSRAGFRPVVKDAGAAPAIVIQHNGRVRDPEGYLLQVTPAGIAVRAATAAGAFYGVQTLLELVRLHGAGLPCCEVDDAPAFRRRGVYLDCSRGKVPKISTLKSLVDLLAAWKINELQLYVENVFAFARHPAIGRGFDPFTPDDLCDLQAYCRLRHIRLVPSLASFGHMEKILMLPRYRKLGEMPGFRGLPGGTTLNPGHPGSIKLLAGLYDEFLPLFDALDFNVCGDEPWELGRGASQAAATRKGVGQVYLDFIMKIRGLCFKHGKRVNLWSDIVLNHPEIIPDIPKDVVMLNWAYAVTRRRGRMQRSHEITDAGLPLVCCPGTQGWQSHGTRLQCAQDAVSRFAGIGFKQRAEGFLNTDWGDGGHRNTLAVSLCGFAHGAAHAWNTRGVDDRQHVELFTRHIFNDKRGRLAAAIRGLGDAAGGNWAYVAFNESLYAPKPFQHFYGQCAVRLNQVALDDAAVRERRAALGRISFKMPGPDQDDFQKLMLEEFELARVMERTAFQRLQLARSIRARGGAAPAELRRHRDRLQMLARDCATTWRKLNRESRLCDNLSMFEAALDEIKLTH